MDSNHLAGEKEQTGTVGWPFPADLIIPPDSVLVVTLEANSATGIQEAIIKHANTTAQEWLRPSSKSLRGLPVEEFVDLVSIGVTTKAIQRVVSGIEIVNADVPLKTDGTAKTARLQITPDTEGGAFVSVSDVTSRKFVRETLIENQALLERIASALPEIVLLVDPDETQVSFASKDLLIYLGYHADSDQALAADWRALIHPDDVSKCEDLRWKSIEAADGEAIEIRCRLRTNRGDWRWFEVRSSVFQRDASGRPIQLLRSIHDVTSQAVSEIALKEKVQLLARQKDELASRQEQLEYLNKQLAALATTDGLTNLYNYRAFTDKLADEVRRAKRYDTPLALVICDIDDFKGFNDHFGHPAGDERLRFFARTLTESSRATDFVARYGGEEFAIILPNTASEGAVSFATSILKKLHEDTSSKAITASFGCVQLDTKAESMDELIERADKCLYSAKRQGKDCVVSDETQDDPLSLAI